MKTDNNKDKWKKVIILEFMPHEESDGNNDIIVNLWCGSLTKSQFFHD